LNTHANSATLESICSINPPLGQAVSAETEITYLPMEHIAEGGGRLQSEIRRRDAIPNGLTAFRDEDVLIAKITPCFENQKGWLAHGLSSGVGYGSTELHVVRAGPRVLPRIVYAHTQSLRFRRLGERFMTGSAGQQRVSADFLRGYRIWLPCLVAQRRIASLDEQLEATLRSTDALIAAKREQKRGLLQQLLTGKVRFPGFTEPWKSVRIGDVLAIDPEQLPAATPPDYTFKYIDLGSVNDGVVEAPTQPIDFATAPSRARRVLRQGDVLLSTVRPLLRGFGMIEAVDGPLVGSTGFAVLRTTRTEDARFILECLFSENVLRQMHARTTGSSYPALGSEDVRSLVIPWPSQSERSRIGAVLTAATKEIRTLAEARGLLATQRRGLMERLLSGEIDIPSSDTSAA
jgi:type I restriction enzyme S subunit